MLRWLWILSMLTSCATVRTTGVFVEPRAPKALHLLASDAAYQLGRIYPAAHTQISFAHETADDFGDPLVTALRSLGFAVAAPTSRGSQLVIAYVVDDVGPLYRVVLRIVTKHRRISLARVYTHEGASLHGAGTWTQQVLP